MRWEWVPEGRCCNGECPITPGALGFFGGEFEEVGIAGSEGTGGGVDVKEVRNVLGCLVVEGLIGGDEDFEIDSLFDREPVEVTEDWCDVVSGAGVGEQAGGRVLNILEFVEGFGVDTVEDAVAVI